MHVVVRVWASKCRKNTEEDQTRGGRASKGKEQKGTGRQSIIASVYRYGFSHSFPSALLSPPSLERLLSNKTKRHSNKKTTQTRAPLLLVGVMGLIALAPH